MEDGDESQSDEERFDPDVIAELVAQGKLVINNDRKEMTLTIELKCDPDSLSDEEREELKKFMKAILKEFNALKEKHPLSDECLKMVEDEKGNIVSLRINLPTLKLYDEFIQRLANNLVPTPRPRLQTKDENSETKSLAPTPLSMEPKPTSKQLEEDEANQSEDISTKTETEEAQKRFNPFSLDLNPWQK
ncbi:hypothetical protein LEST103851_12000 [Legionella steigerwaltii]